MPESTFERGQSHSSSESKKAKERKKERKRKRKKKKKKKKKKEKKEKEKKDKKGNNRRGCPTGKGQVGPRTGKRVSGEAPVPGSDRKKSDGTTNQGGGRDKKQSSKLNNGKV